MDKKKLEEEAKAVGVRRISRKPDHPRANQRDYSKENERMGVTSEVDLILDTMQRAEAQQKFTKDLHGYSSAKETVVKKEKESKFLTVQGLLDHPYFISINEADISSVIDEFERLQSPGFVE